MRLNVWVWVVLSGSGCPTDPEAPKDSGTDNTSPGTTPPGAVDATGRWVGDCLGDFTAGTASGTFAMDIAVDIDLVDTAGALTGTVDGTQDGTPWNQTFTLAGTRTGSEVAFAFVGYDGATTPSFSTDSDIRWELTLAGDTMTGVVIFDPTQDPLEVPCTLQR